MKGKVPYSKQLLDIQGAPILVGSKIAYAVRVGNCAQQRVGEVLFVESVQDWRGMDSPVIYAKFDGNIKMSRCSNVENMVVLS